MAIDTHNKSAPPLISVVVPAFDEEEVLPELLRRLTAALADESFEIVVVDDGSRDRTPEVLATLAAQDGRVVLVRLARNFGHQAAITAGLETARGKAIVTIDADLQDPPELIPELVARWRAGADVVHAVRHLRTGEPVLRLKAISAFYRVFSRLTNLESFPGNTGDFRLMSRYALDTLLSLPERTRFLRGLISWVGLRQDTVEYERDPRLAGRSKYPYSKLVMLALDGIVSFSTIPLRIAGWLGFAFSLLAFLLIPLVLVSKLTGLYKVSGIATVGISVLFFGGIQLLFLGVMGEYLARNYEESKGRPIYVLAPPPDLDDGRSR